MLFTKEECEELVDRMLREARIPREDREDIRVRTLELLSLYEGQEPNTIGLLWKAVEAKRFDEIAESLREYHADFGVHVPVAEREFVAGTSASLLRKLQKYSKALETGRRTDSDKMKLPLAYRQIMEMPGAIDMELFMHRGYRKLENGR